MTLSQQAFAGRQTCQPDTGALKWGSIPKDWCICQLDSLGTGLKPPIKAGPFGSSLTKAMHVSAGYKVYGQEQVIRGDPKHGDYFITRGKYRDLKSCAVHPGDILMSLVGTVGKLLVVPDDAELGIINPRLIRFSFDRKRILPGFFRLLFESEQVQLLLSRSIQGGTMGILNARILLSFSILVPPLPEQRAIAEALSDIDRLLGSLDALIAKKMAIKQAAMQQLLTGKARVHDTCGSGDGPFRPQHTELHAIPEDWEVATIEQLFNFERTASNSRSDLDDAGDVAYVHYGDLHTRFSHFVDFSRAQLPHLSEPLEVTATLLRDGDLVVADASEDEAGVGKSAEVRNVGSKAAISGLHTFLLRARDRRICCGYRGYLLENELVKQQIKRLATGLKVFGISKGALAKVLIPLPPCPEQRTIAKVLSDMDAEIAVLEQRRDKTQDIKLGTMQQLLTGRVRLVTDRMAHR